MSLKTTSHFVEVVQRLPQFIRRVLVVGHEAGLLEPLLRRRGAEEIHGIGGNASVSEKAVSCLDSFLAGDPRFLQLPFDEGGFDCIILDTTAGGICGIEDVLRRLAAFLARRGCVVLIAGNPLCRRARESGPPPMGLQEVQSAATEANLLVYARWPFKDPAAGELRPDADGNLLLDGQSIHVDTPEELEDLTTSACAYLAVRLEYNPVSHARELFDDGHPEWGYEVLSAIPQAYVADPQVAAVVASEMQLCLLAWDKKAADSARIERFYQGLRLFHRASTLAPDLCLSYQCQAEFWHRIGDTAMASRVLRTSQHISPNESTERQLERYLQAAPPAEKGPEATPPAWTPEGRPPRVLFITNPRPHYGLDVLFDGLCGVLGAENVIDFPWKATLHGEPPTDQRDYPCMFGHPGTRLDLDGVAKRLCAGAFDLILFGDVELAVPEADARRLIEAAGDIPLFIVDAQDEPNDYRPAVLRHIGASAATGYFKREMLTCVDYGPAVFPLPFGYPDGRVPAAASVNRPEPFFWAGHRSAGLRRLYVERIEQMLNRKFDAQYTQQEYVDALSRTRIGLNAFGFGFDTVRYWELPAHGCMLLSERPPIRIPHNFRDGESAVFFDDLADLEAKLEHYLAHPDEAAAIATRGREHLMEFHTGSARARQLLGWIEDALPRGRISTVS